MELRKVEFSLEEGRFCLELDRSKATPGIATLTLTIYGDSGKQYKEKYNIEAECLDWQDMDALTNTIAGSKGIDSSRKLDAMLAGELYRLWRIMIPVS